MSRDPASDEPSALADWLAVPATGISLLTFRSQLIFQQIIEAIREDIPRRPIHIVVYDPADPEAPAGTAAAVVGKCRELADGSIPAIILRPVTARMEAAETANAVAFWKNLNHLRERIGDLPAQIVLCVDEIQKPYAYGYAKDLIAWCSPRFLFPQLSSPPDWKAEQSTAKSGESADYAAASLFWRSLHPTWATLISSGDAITADDVRHILIPLMDAALGMGLVTQADKIYQQSKAGRLEVYDEDIQLVWLNVVGQLESLKGDLPAAAKAYTAGLEIAQALAARDPENTDWQRDLSVSHNRLGDIAVAQGDLPAAAKAYTAQNAIAQALAARDPENTEWRRDLSVSHDRLGDIAVAQGDLPAAAKAYTAALEIRQTLAARDPENTEWLRDLSVSHDRLGDIAVAQGDLPAAAKAYTAQNAIAQALAARDLGNTQWQRDLSVSHNKLGDIARAQGNLPAAAKAYSTGMSIAQALAARDPENTEWQRDLFVSHYKLATLAEKAGDAAEARAQYRKSHDILQALADKGKHVSPQDMKALAMLKEKAGIE